MKKSFSILLITLAFSALVAMFFIGCSYKTYNYYPENKQSVPDTKFYGPLYISLDTLRF